jgi:protein-tyrosine phosphatase
MDTLKVLFVCMGNICRSPTAEGVLRHHARRAGLLEAFEIDSAGTHNYHPDAPPDSRSQTHAKQRGYDLSDLRARQITDADFEHFDLILTMDWDNQALTEAACPAPLRQKVRRFAEFFITHDDAVVPDPYFGGDGGFVHVLDLCEDGAQGLIQYVSRKKANN